MRCNRHFCATELLDSYFKLHYYLQREALAYKNECASLGNVDLVLRNKRIVEEPCFDKLQNA